MSFAAEYDIKIFLDALYTSLLADKDQSGFSKELLEKKFRDAVKSIRGQVADVSEVAIGRAVIDALIEHNPALAPRNVIQFPNRRSSR